MHPPLVRVWLQEAKAFNSSHELADTLTALATFELFPTCAPWFGAYIGSFPLFGIIMLVSFH